MKTQKSEQDRVAMASTSTVAAITFSIDTSVKSQPEQIVVWLRKPTHKRRLSAPSSRVGRFCIHSEVKPFFKIRVSQIAISTCLALGLLSGCQQKGSSSSESDKASGGSKQGGGKQGGGGGNAAGTMTEPATSTTGSPDGPAAAASDDGSPAATAHQPTAMPGAPQPTIPDKEQPKQKPPQQP